MEEKGLLDLNILVLKVCSMYPMFQINATGFQKFLDFFYKTISVGVLYFGLVSLVYDLYLKERPGISSYSIIILNVLAFTCSILSVHFYHIRGNAIRKMINDMNDLFKFESIGIFKKDMGDSIRLTRNITIAFTLLTTSATTFMSLLPLFHNGKKRILPVPGTYPYNYEASPCYEIVYLIQMYSEIIMGALTGAADSFFMCVALTAAAQFEILGNNFNNCVFNTLLDHGISKNDILQYIKSSESETFTERNDINKLITTVLNSENFNEKLNKRFIGHINHHQKLLTFCEKIEQLFFPFIFIKTSINVFYNVFIPFSILTSTESMSLKLTLAQYEACAISELLIYCISGQAIISNSEAIMEQLYFSPWYFCGRKHRSLVHMVIMRSNRPVRVSVAKLYTMSHATFIMIIKASLSYLAVLRQLID